MRPPENFHHALSTPKRWILSNIFKNGFDDDDAAARTGPRVSSGTRTGMGKGYTHRPSRRDGGTHGRHCVGVSHSTRISPDPQKTMTSEAPSCSTKLAAHQLAPPRSCNHRRCLIVTKVVRPTRSRRDSRERGTAEQRTCGRTRPPPPVAVTDRTQQQEQSRPPGPAKLALS
jgi:hypothetical protein